MRLGKNAARPRATDLRLARYAIADELPVAPRRYGFGRLYPDWGMLGNDQYGDCVWAGADHETMILNKARHGIDVTFAAENALSDYAAVTGFNPVTGAGDDGTYVDDAMIYRRKTGVIDAHGARHKVYAYAALDAKDWGALVQAAYLFGVVGIGFEFPSTAWAQFDAGAPWDMTDISARIEGGHYVPVVGSLNSPEKVTCISWGRRQEMTRDFYEEYNDEAWVVLSQEMIRTDGTGLHGWDWQTFLDDLRQVAPSTSG